METLFLSLGWALGERIIIDEVSFAAKERFDFVAQWLLCFFIRRRLGGLAPEIKKPEKVSVVSDGNGFLPERRGAIHESVNAAATIKEAIIGMDVQVDKIRAGRRVLDWCSDGIKAHACTQGEKRCFLKPLTEFWYNVVWQMCSLADEIY